MYSSRLQNYHQLKIFRFLKKKDLKNFNIFFDIGAHKGESINLFLKNLNIDGRFSPYAITENGSIYDSLLWKTGSLGRLTSFKIQTRIDQIITPNILKKGKWDYFIIKFIEK